MDAPLNCRFVDYILGFKKNLVYFGIFWPIFFMDPYNVKCVEACFNAFTGGCVAELFRRDNKVEPSSIANLMESQNVPP